MIAILIEADGVAVTLPDYFRRPLRPSPEQTFVLLTAAKVLTSIEGASASGALRSALTKVTAALGGEAVPFDVELDDAPDGTLTLLRDAVASCRSVELEYFSYGRDVVSTRVVDPWRVQQADGHWYLQGFCHDRAAERVFRVDRIVTATLADASFTAPTPMPPFRSFDVDDVDGLVTLRLGPGAGWVLEYYPHVSTERSPDGSIDVVLPVTSARWLERLLLRLGPDVDVVDAPDELRDADSVTLRGLLDRYRK